jgi:hypothetical protein
MVLNLEKGKLATKTDTAKTTVTCSCGKSCLTFKDTKPIWRADCCCGDCYQKVDWVKSKGWPGKLPKGPLDTYYIQNSICNIKGK